MSPRRLHLSARCVLASSSRSFARAALPALLYPPGCSIPGSPLAPARSCRGVARGLPPERLLQGCRPPARRSARRRVRSPRNNHPPAARQNAFRRVRSLSRARSVPHRAPRLVRRSAACPAGSSGQAGSIGQTEALVARQRLSSRWLVVAEAFSVGGGGSLRIASEGAAAEAR